ncbi:MAG: hypothetical protein P8179_05600 [Candidatus Thiodiazotropha sp.]|jgi:hypothetical protein
MTHFFKFLPLLLIFMSSQLFADLKPIDSINTPGVYLSTNSGYVKIEPYKHDYRFVDFNFLNELPYAVRNEQRLVVVIYEKDFNPDSVELELRPLDVKVKLQKLKFTVHPMKKPDMYELIVDEPISDGAMLHVRSWSYFENFGAIMLGETEQQLVNFFSLKEMPNASTVVQYLSDAQVAFPDNKKLQDLAAYWKKAAEIEIDNRDYTYVQEKWQSYEEATKLSLKERYLNALIGEINGYLSTHPKGVHAEEASQRRDFAEEQLKELEKLL